MSESRAMARIPPKTAPPARVSASRAGSDGGAPTLTDHASPHSNAGIAAAVGCLIAGLQVTGTSAPRA